MDFGRNGTINVAESGIPGRPPFQAADQAPRDTDHQPCRHACVECPLQTLSTSTSAYPHLAFPCLPCRSLPALPLLTLPFGSIWHATHSVSSNEPTQILWNPLPEVNYLPLDYPQPSLASRVCLFSIPDHERHRSPSPNTDG